MKIEVAVLFDPTTSEHVWADEADSGRGYVLKFPAGREVPDKWLEENGLADPEPEPEKVAPPKQVAKPNDKSVKAPAANK